MLLNIIAGTPWWVWIVFVYLVFVGLKARLTQTVYLPVLFIVPALFTGLKFSALGVAGFAYYAPWLIPGAIAGFLMTYYKPATFHKNNFTVTVPGSWQTFALLMLLFSMRYVFGYLQSQHPELMLSCGMIELALHATFAGIFWGRALCYTYRFYRA